MQHRVSFYFILTIIALLGCHGNIAHAEPLKKSVRVVYLVPKDRQENAAYCAGIERCVLELQAWYFAHLGGKTFRVNDPLVEVHRTPHEAAWYDSTVPANKPDQKYYTWYNALADAGTLLGAKHDDPEFVWFIYIDAVGGTGAGMKGIAILPEHDLLGLIGKAGDGTKIPRWIGGGGHELGHAFGLPHPGEMFPTALMQGGYSAYPACYLTPDETRMLDGSPFLHAGRPESFKTDGRMLTLYAGGYFVRSEGKTWLEGKTGNDELHPFQHQSEDETRLQLLDATRKPGAWISLPKPGKGKDILFKWEGEEWRKIYEVRE